MLSGVYPIVDTAACAARGVGPLGVAAACLRGGARLLQLRVKEAGSAAFLDLARRMRELTARQGARLIVNDRTDLALLAGADGVHVGQDDLPVAQVRKLAGAEFIVGLSTHTVDQVDAAAREAVSYIAVGPVFGTTTKDTGYTARGLELVRYAAATGLPVVGIGGITLANAPSVIDAGAASVAVITDLLDGDDVARRTRAYRSTLTRG